MLGIEKKIIIFFLYLWLCLISDCGLPQRIKGAVGVPESSHPNA